MKRAFGLRNSTSLAIKLASDSSNFAVTPLVWFDGSILPTEADDEYAIYNDVQPELLQIIKNTNLGSTGGEWDVVGGETSKAPQVVSSGTKKGLTSSTNRCFTRGPIFSTQNSYTVMIFSTFPTIGGRSSDSYAVSIGDQPGLSTVFSSTIGMSAGSVFKIYEGVTATSVIPETSLITNTHCMLLHCQPNTPLTGSLISGQSITSLTFNPNTDTSADIAIGGMVFLLGRGIQSVSGWLGNMWEFAIFPGTIQATNIRSYLNTKYGEDWSTT